MEAIIENLFIAAVIIQNISLLRVLRIGPFSAIDFVLTYWGGHQIARQTRSWYVHLYNPWINFLVLLGIGEGLHYLLDLNTPLEQYVTTASTLFHYYVTYGVCLTSYYLGFAKPCLCLLVN